MTTPIPSKIQHKLFVWSEPSNNPPKDHPFSYKVTETITTTKLTKIYVLEKIEREKKTSNFNVNRWNSKAKLLKGRKKGILIVKAKLLSLPHHTNTPAAIKNERKTTANEIC